MKKIKQNVKGLFKGRLKKTLSTFLSVSMCLTLLGGAVEVFASQTDHEVTDEAEYETAAEVTDEGGIRLLDIDPDAVPDSVTVLPEDTTVPPSDGKILFKNAVVELSDELTAAGAWIYSSGNTIYPYIPVEEEGATYENPLKITAKNVAVIDGRAIDVELQFTELSYGELSSTSLTNINNNDCAYVSFMHTDDNGRMRLSGLDYYWADSGKNRYSYATTTGMRIYPSGGTEVSYELKIKWSDTGEIVDLPFYQVAYDLDMGNGSNITTSEGYTFTDGIDRYYVYEGTKLQCIEESDGLYFGATGNTDVNGDASYKQAGVIAHSTNGTFSATCHVISACYNYFEIYSDYLNIHDPVKTVTSEGTNYDSSYAEGDTVTYEITQQMGEIYVDCFGEYNSLVITDTIPEGLTLESYEMYSGTEKLGSQDGTWSYDSGKLTWTFSDSWIRDLSNYAGQDLKLAVTCAVDDGFLGNSPYKTVTNTAYSYFSGLEYGPGTADIKVENEPELSVSKKITNANYNSVYGSLYKGDTFTYEITVSQTKENAVAENVVVTDTLTGDGTGPFEIISVTADNASVNRSGTDITATCGDLSYGESSTVCVEVEIVWTYDEWIEYSHGEQNIYNYAYASADNAEECVGSCDFQIGQVGSLKVEKSMNPQNATKNTEWTFTLSNGENTFTKTLTGSGSVTFEEVPAGTYTLSESCDEKLWGAVTQSVQIGSGTTTTVQLTNTAATGNVKVVNTVTDPSGMYPYGLDGFSFTLEGTADIGVDVSMSAETDASGNLTFENVYAGTYTLKKTGTPDNTRTLLVSRIASWLGAGAGIPDWWDTDDTWTVTVEKGKTAVVETENIYKTGNVRLDKYTDPSGSNLNNSWTFTLEGTSDSGVDVRMEKTFSGEGTALYADIPIGTYTLTEEYDSDVWKSGSVTQSITVGYNETVAVAVTNTAETGGVSVQKNVDDPSNLYDSGLDGFTFNLSGVSDIGVNVDMTATTGENGIAEFIGVYPGKYTVTETGTEGSGEVASWWDTDGQWDVLVSKNSVTWSEAENIYETGSVYIRKSIVKYEESGKELNGFAFRLEGVSDAGTEVELYSVTDETGLAEFNGVPVGSGYELTEVSADDIQAAADEGNVSAQEISELEFTVQDPDEYLETYPQTVEVVYLETTEVEFENEVHPELHVTKTADGTEYYVGDVITYTIEVTQTIPGATSRDIEVVDDLPAGVTLVGTPVLTGVEGTVGPVGSQTDAEYTENEDTEEYAREEAEDEDMTEYAREEAEDEDMIEYAREEAETEDMTDEAREEAEDEDMTEDNQEEEETEEAEHESFTVYIPELAYGETAVITVYAVAGSELAGSVAVNRVKVADRVLDEDEDSVSLEILEPEPDPIQEEDTDLYQPEDTDEDIEEDIDIDEDTDEEDEEIVWDTPEPQSDDPAGTGDSRAPVALAFTIFAAAFVTAITAVRRRKV